MKSFLVLLVLLAVPAFGSVSVSKEYIFSPSLIATIEQNVHQAASREAELQEYPVFYTIDQANGISLWCPPHMPKVDGTGCSLNFSIKSDSWTMTIKKGLALSFTSKQVSDQLKANDPNSIQDHQHFGSPFEQKDAFGNHYYCQPRFQKITEA